MSGKKVAYVTLGTPASGKTTWANKMMHRHGLVNINLDDCRWIVCGDSFNQEATAAAVELHTRMIDTALAAGNNFVVSDTNLNWQFLQPLMSKIEVAGFDVVLVVFDTDFQVCLERNMLRDNTIPFKAMTRMDGMFQTMKQMLTQMDVEIWNVRN